MPRPCPILSAAALALSAGCVSAQGGWRRAVLSAPEAIAEPRMVYDSARGRSVLYDGDHAETWEWDGSAWTRRNPAANPNLRAGHAMAYDAGRGRVVLFGGKDRTGAPLGDTWEWDGVNWALRGPARSPPARQNAAMAHDAVRGQTVLFGGVVGPYGVLGDTWEWDGVNWAQRATAVAPQARVYHAMAFDPWRGRTVLFGGWIPYVGLPADTWEWDGTTWTLLSPRVAPPPRTGHAIAFDTARARAVLFGGVFLPGTAPAFGDTWEWDGTVWVPRAPPTSPSTRNDHAFAYDWRRGRAVLFGGADVTLPLSDTWEWDGTTWILAQPPPRPPAMEAFMAYDPSRRRSVLFQSAGGLGGIWEWDGSVWSQRTAAQAPGLRGSCAVAFDPVRGRMVLHGGYGGVPSGSMGDTWEWDGTAWWPVAPSSVTMARYGHALAFDPVSGRTLLFGGNSGRLFPSFLNDTWEWDGTAWTRRSPAASPPPRMWHALATDQVRGRIVLFGGFDAAFQPLGDTWEWDGTNWAQTAAPGPPGRGLHAMAWNPASGRVLIAGGSTHPRNAPAFPDTWEWDGTTWARRSDGVDLPPLVQPVLAGDVDRRGVVMFGGRGYLPRLRALSETWEYGFFGIIGPGHPGGGLAVTWALPRAGRSFCVTFSNPPPAGTRFTLLLLAPGPALSPPLTVNPPAACSPAFLHLVPQLVMSAMGDPVTYCVPIPDNPALVGQPFTAQGAALQVGVCFLATDALGGTIQP